VNKYSKLLDTLIRQLDRNTRGIAKLFSAATYLLDEYGEVKRDAVAPMFEALYFQLIQERRNFKVKFEAELARLRVQTSA
jgi:hypothetical protein